MKFTDLTEEQKEHLLHMLEQFEPPIGTTHLDVNDKEMGSFMKIKNGVMFYWDAYENYWEEANEQLVGELYQFPTDVRYKGEIEEEFDISEPVDMSPFNLEDKIMNAWCVFDDLKLLRDSFDTLDEDRRMNILTGLIDLGDLKMQGVWDAFETLMANRKR